MSEAINNSITSTSYGIIGQLVANAASVQQRESALTAQSSSGLVSNTYSGLGTSVNLPLSLQPLINLQQTWQNNIDYAVGKMQVTQATMSQLSDIATKFYADTNSLDGINASDVNSIAANAQSALQQVAQLLDTVDGSAYIFGGQDTGNPPVPSPDSILTSSFYTDISTQVGTLGSASVSDIIAGTLTTAKSTTMPANGGTSPFSTYLTETTPPATQTIQVGADSTVNVGLLASANTYAVSTGTSTTGSYIRDLMRGLATLGSLTSTQVQTYPTDFATLVSDTRTSLQGVVSALNVDAGALGDLQTRMTQTKTNLNQFQTALSNQVSSVQDVDMASTLSQLTTVQNQLSASYQLIAKQQNLSLVYYL